MAIPGENEQQLNQMLLETLSTTDEHVIEPRMHQLLHRLHQLCHSEKPLLARASFALMLELGNSLSCAAVKLTQAKAPAARCVVLVLGFGGSSISGLSPIVELYAAEKCAVISCTFPSHLGVRSAAIENVMAALEAQLAECPHLVIHCCRYEMRC